MTAADRYPGGLALAALAGKSETWLAAYRIGWKYAEDGSVEMMKRELRSNESDIEVLRYHEDLTEACARLEGLLAGWEENGGGGLRQPLLR